MSVRVELKKTENSMDLLIVSKRLPRVMVYTVSTEDSVFQSLVSLPIEPHISVCTILEEPSSSPTLSKPTSSPCGPSLNSLPLLLVSSHIPSIPSEEDSWCSLVEVTFSTPAQLIALIKSWNKKVQVLSSREPYQTLSEELVEPWCLSSTIRFKVSFFEQLTAPKIINRLILTLH